MIVRTVRIVQTALGEPLEGIAATLLRTHADDADGPSSMTGKPGQLGKANQINPVPLRPGIDASRRPSDGEAVTARCRLVQLPADEVTRRHGTPARKTKPSPHPGSRGPGTVKSRIRDGQKQSGSSFEVDKPPRQ